MFEELQEIVWSYTGNRDVTITNETLLLSDIGLNSIELIDMLSEVEERFDIEILDRAISRLRTVQDLLDYLSEQ